MRRVPVPGTVDSPATVPVRWLYTAGGASARAMLGEEAIVVDDDAEAFDLNVRRLQKKSGGGSMLNLIGSEDGNRQRELDGTGKLLVGDALSSRSDSTSLGRGPSFAGETLSNDQGVKDITEMIGAELNGLGCSNVKDFMFRASAKSSSARVPSAEPAPVSSHTRVFVSPSQSSRAKTQNAAPKCLSLGP